jgi:hypothetical protein
MHVKKLARLLIVGELDFRSGEPHTGRPNALLPKPHGLYLCAVTLAREIWATDSSLIIHRAALCQLQILEGLKLRLRSSLVVRAGFRHSVGIEHFLRSRPVIREHGSYLRLAIRALKDQRGLKVLVEYVVRQQELFMVWLE